MSRNLNVNIKIAEAKDLYGGRVGDKYLGALDYSLFTDYIENNETLKDIIKEQDGVRYSDDIICVNFNYAWEGIKSAEDLLRLKNLEIILNELKFKYIKMKDDKVTELKIQCVKKYCKNAISITRKNINRNMKIALELASTKEDEIIIKKEYRELKKNNIDYYRRERDSAIEELMREITTIKGNIKHVKDLKNNITRKYIKSTKDLREVLYKDGFTIDDKHYVRLFRSSGSSRVGKCLFINKDYYNELIEWVYAGIDVEGKEIDLAGFESYISLVASGSVGRFKLKSENILLMDDYYSRFLNNEETMVTRLMNKELNTTREKLKIKNNIWDGQAFIDSSIFKETELMRENLSLEEKATMQIRNKFYKGQGVSSNIKQFYINYCKEKGFDYNTYKVKDMFGNEILAKDVLMITTPSSLKYLKYFEDKKAGYDRWKEVASEYWAICKYDKPTHHFEGMTQTHYQLLNTLGLSKEKMRELLKDTIDYINLLKTDDKVFKYNVNIKNEIDEDFTINSKDKMIKALLTWNDDFIKTKVCWDYRKDIIESYIDNVKCGHILVEGNYSIVANNVVEMLYASVGDLVEIDGRLQIKDKPEIRLEGYECISNKFDNVEEFAAVRSPQPSMANVGVFKNRKCPNNAYYKELSKYFNVESKEIIFTNSINCNTMEKFSSMDFDIDAVLITNNPIIVDHAKGIQHFAVNNDMTEKTPVLLKRTPENLSKTDIACGQSKIGEVINLVQHLNSIYWDSIYNGKTHEELEELYKDICQLNSLSCIEIDKCKKTSQVNTFKELKKIREKGYFEDGVKPRFMKYCNEYEAPNGQEIKKPTYIKYEAGMDYLNDILKEDLITLNDIKYTTLSHICSKEKGEANRDTVNKVSELINVYFKEINNIYADKKLSKEEQHSSVYELELKCAKDEAVVKKLQDKKVIKSLIKRCEKYAKYTKEINKIRRSLETATNEEKINKLNADLEKYIKWQEKYIKFRNFRRILKIIFLVDKTILKDCFKNKVSDNVKKPYMLYGHKKLI